MPKATAVPSACELCGLQLSGNFGDRVKHIKGTHPRYGAGLLLRMGSPLLFLAALGVASLAGGNQRGYMAALVLGIGASFVGRFISISERRQAGARATIGMKRMLKEGGLPIVLMIPILLFVVYLLGKA